MLSSVTSYFFGSASTESENIVSPVDLKTKESNEGWVIVDVNDESEQCQQEQNKHAPALFVIMEPDTAMSEGESCPSESETDFGGSQSTSTPDSMSPNRQGHFKYRAKVQDNSESWIMTPAPCFTSRTRNPSVCEQHPLENLLIEHPSMSVYNSICDSTVSELSLVSVSSESERMEEEPVSSRTRQQTPAQETQQVAAARRHQVHLVTPTSGLNIQLDKVKGVKQQQRKSTRKFNNSHLERSNKCREFQSCGKKQRQRNKNLCRSGAMNSRYGQRK